MLPKINRGLKKIEVDELWNKAGYIKGEKFMVKWTFENDREKKVAVAVGKKYDKRAVARNRMKRMVFNVIKDRLGGLREGIRVLVVVKSEAGKILAEEAKRELDGLINRFK